MYMFFISLFCAIAFATCGQVLLKLSTESNVWSLPQFPVINILFISAALFYFISMLFYTFSLNKLPLTIAYPSMALSYPMVAGISHFIWKTPFGLVELFSYALIIFALFLLGYQGASYIQN
jgi:multidrug transporter EmrE-like cation transporter